MGLFRLTIFLSMISLREGRDYRLLEFLTAMIWVVPLGILIHELGHAIPTVLINQGEAKVRIGFGPKLIQIKMGKLHLYIHAIFFLGGHTESRHNCGISLWREAMITLSGPLMNLFFFFLLYLWLEEGNTFLWFNLYLSVVNLIPFYWKGKYSDGYRFFHILLNKQLHKTT